jgi:hypothetical protein
MTSQVRIIAAPEGGWTVAIGEVSLVGFYGPDARHMAERHRELLIAALTHHGLHRGAEHGEPLTHSEL